MMPKTIVIIHLQLEYTHMPILLFAPHNCISIPIHSYISIHPSIHPTNQPFLLPKPFPLPKPFSPLPSPSPSPSHPSETTVTSPDAFDKNSLEFFNRAKLKMSYSLYWAAWFLVLLGFTSVCASNCQAYSLYGDYLKNAGLVRRNHKKLYNINVYNVLYAILIAVILLILISSLYVLSIICIYPILFQSNKYVELEYYYKYSGWGFAAFVT